MEMPSADRAAAILDNERYVPNDWTGVIGDPTPGTVDQLIFMPVIGGRP